MTIFEGLQPNSLWKYFWEILQIPRPSNQEEQIKAYLIQFAKNQGLSHQTDQTGNILISKKATPGYENSPGVILQSHMDMVCEKNADIQHDFNTDPIQAYVDGDWIRSKGTTLGADDGIGMAAQLAVLAADNLNHGSLECLFTVDEETGLKGAFGLEPNFLQGEILLNLDSEDEGEIFIGCAGGIDTTAWFPYTQTPLPDGFVAYKLVVQGLKGGHSGDDIHKGLGNSVKIAARVLWEIQQSIDLRLQLLEGGNLRNALAREAEAILAVPGSQKERLQQQVTDLEKNITAELMHTEPGLSIELHAVDPPPFYLDHHQQDKLLKALYACPHGVYAWSPTLANMVETSTNLAAIKLVDQQFKVTTSQRSSLASAKHDIANMVRSALELGGASTEHSGAYPGWNPNPDSKLVRLSAEIYQRLYSTEPIVRAIHAGLECGLFLEKYPNLDMISFGPTIRGAHSPDERLDIPSTSKFWNYLVALLAAIK